MDVRVAAIRAHKLVGKGSCTSIDECYDDADLIEELNRHGIKTPGEAVKWALDKETLRRELALDARCGEDDDEQLKSWKQWNEAIKGMV